MPAASRVQLVPPGPWDEEKLLAAAREYAASGKPVRPGDALGELIIVSVDPAPGATLTEETEVEILPTPPKIDSAQAEVVILIDVSESMGLPWDGMHTRLQAARTSVASFLDKPGTSVRNVTLFEYAKEPRLLAGPSPASSIRLHEAPVPKGGSATAKALNAALAQVAASTPTHTHVIFLLTDGVGEVADLLVASERAGRLKVPIHSIVFAPEVDEIFEELAHISGGSFQRAGHPLSIEFEHQPGV